MDPFEKMLLLGTSDSIIHVVQFTIHEDAAKRIELINEMIQTGVLQPSTQDVRDSNLENWMEQKLGELRATLLTHGFMSRPGTEGAEVYFRIS